MILSHRKSNFRKIQYEYIRNNVNNNMMFNYFIGDESIDNYYKVIENDIILVKCPDNYESLSMKTFLAIKYIFENKINQINGIFKTDDDITIDINKLYKCIEDNSNKTYFGFISNSKIEESDYHFGKCESEELNKKLITTPNSFYCAGGGYFLNKSILHHIVENESEFRKLIFEDICVGVVMNKYGIYPYEVDIKNNGCNW